MAAAYAVDGDGDYSYDLSLDEEELLRQLIDAIPTPPPLTSRRPPDDRPQGTLEVSIATPPPKADVSATTTELERSLVGNGSVIDTARLDSGDAHRHVFGPLGRGALGNGETTVAGAHAGLPAFVESSKSKSVPTIYPPTDTGYSDLSRAPNDVEKQRDIEDGLPMQIHQRGTPPEEDTRSPLQRFRSFPRKPFSVSDLTAGAWCELQYFYTLTRLPWGKKTITGAMKSGIKVHKDLEDKAHVAVEVEIAKREDAFGLKIWNIIQRLRTLRDTGLTRELEVWGMVEGNVASGVIDGLSYENPNPGWEAEAQGSQRSSVAISRELPRPQQQQRRQQKITSFFETSEESPSPALPEKKIYLTDVKTRGSRRLPSRTAIRASEIQLFLYHRFLSDMAANHLDYLRVFRRYGLDADEPFSDTFTAQIGGLYDEIFYDTASDRPLPGSSGVGESAKQDHEERSSSPAPDLIRYGSLRELVPLLQSELALTFPQGSESLGSLVKVEYRTRGKGGDDKGAGDDTDAAAGVVIGQCVFPVDGAMLQLYLKEDMKWWRGERPPKGVPIEETHKCRSCEFADACSWRKARDEEILTRTRERLAALKADAAAAVSNGRIRVEGSSAGGDRP